MNEHSPKFEEVKKYYNTFKPDGTRVWGKSAVRTAVTKGWITAEEYEEIVGEPFE